MAQVQSMPAGTTGQPVHRVVIEPKPGWIAVDWRELVEFRELLYFLTLRDLKVRYKQTVLGAAWAVLTPLMNMVVFTVVFGGIAKMPTDGVPKPLFFFAATVPWALFTTTLNGAANSLVSNAYLIRKIYFPRLYMPLTQATVALVDFLLAFAVLLVMMLAMGYAPNVHALWLPVWVVLTLITALGAGLWLAALMVPFRDVRNLIAFGIQAWMYATPVVYPRSAIKHPAAQWIFDANPMTPVVEGFRWALLGTPTGPTPRTALSVAVALAVFVTGLYFFRRMEKTFADIS